MWISKVDVRAWYETRTTLLESSGKQEFKKKKVFYRS
jgi:hypothetical protein